MGRWRIVGRLDICALGCAQYKMRIVPHLLRSASFFSHLFLSALWRSARSNAGSALLCNHQQKAAQQARSRHQPLSWRSRGGGGFAPSAAAYRATTAPPGAKTWQSPSSRRQSAVRANNFNNKSA